MTHATDKFSDRFSLEPYLDDLEARINPDVETQLMAEWTDFLNGGFHGDIFSPERPEKSPPSIPWPDVTVNQAIDDYDLMALQQYKGASDALASGTGTILNVRANYGTGILASPFGVKLFFMDEELNTLPTNWPLEGGVDAIRKRLEAGIPDIHSALAGKTLEMGARFANIADRYPKIGRFIQIYHPDMQSPMDICELVWGSHLFTDIIDMPELVKDLLELITETYIVLMKEWVKTCPFNDDYNAHWGFLIKGAIMLRSDSAMNFSPRMYKRFILPYDQRILNEFGGGAVHFCGKGDHYISQTCDMDGMNAINMSQPEYNDMDVIFQNTVDKGIPIIALSRQTAQEAIRAGRDLHGLVHSCDAILKKIRHDNV